VILVGYALMTTGITEDPATVSGKWNNPLAVIVAPILLILGYCVIIPYSIIKIFRKKEVNP
jgi:NADH:ubiquinone oxidoreductase subunit 6 (subunit J)